MLAKQSPVESGIASPNRPGGQCQGRAARNDRLANDKKSTSSHSAGRRVHP